MYTWLARDGRFELRVFFMTDRGARPYYDAFARKMVQFDNPILEGYDHVFLSRGEPKGTWAQRTEFVKWSLRRELAAWHPEAVYFHGYDNPAFWPAIAWCRRNGVAVLLRGENEDVLPRPPLRRALRETFLRMLIPRVDAFLYIGAENRQFFLRRGVPDSRLFYVPYSVDNSYFRGGVSESDLATIRTTVRQKYGFAPDVRLFIYTHKLRGTMRPLDAVRAFANAAPAFTRPAAFLVCGDGELRGEVEAAIAGVPRGTIALAGFIPQSELRDSLLASDVMINPAIEPWGCSTNEGIASGLAQISSDMVVGWPDMVRSGENGEVYPCGNDEALERLIVDFANCSKEKIEAMKRRSFELATDVLSFRTCADGIDAAIRAVAAVRAPR